MSRCVIGDCLELLPAMEPQSIDACVTDPPYGIGFMGKKWDTFKPGVVREAHRLIKAEPIVSDNPNLNGRRRSPAVSVSQIAYDRGLEGQRGFQAWTELWAREVMRVLKPGAHLLVCGAPRSYHRMASGLEDAGFEIRDCIMWVFGQGFPKSHNLKDDWKGWGTALKPAWEPIIVARKLLIGTVAANVNVHGVGAINIEASRVPVEDAAYARNCSGDRGHAGTRTVEAEGATNLHAGGGSAAAGRWPANLIHDGSDEVVELFPAEAGAMAQATRRNPDQSRAAYGAFSGTDESGRIPDDRGSAARFFYCAKTSRTDRDEGCDALERKPLNWSSGTQSPGTFQSEGTDKSARNSHPTVKPTSLMRYLCRLVTPSGGVILDPFAGSGSTGKAAMLEGFEFVGIEREAEYARIAEARIDHAAAQGRLVA